MWTRLSPSCSANRGAAHLGKMLQDRTWGKAVSPVSFLISAAVEVKVPSVLPVIIPPHSRSIPIAAIAEGPARRWVCRWGCWLLPYRDSG